MRVDCLRRLEPPSVKKRATLSSSGMRSWVGSRELGVRSSASRLAPTGLGQAHWRGSSATNTTSGGEETLSDRDLRAIVSAASARVLDEGRARLEIARVGEHDEFAITPIAADACPVTVVGVVPTEVTLSVGSPPLAVELWAGDEVEGGRVLTAYLEAVFAGAVSETAWIEAGQARRGSVLFTLPDGRTVKHRYSSGLGRAGKRTTKAFQPY